MSHGYILNLFFNIIVFTANKSKKLLDEDEVSQNLAKNGIESLLKASALTNKLIEK